MPLNPEQNQQLDDDLWNTLKGYTPPLTEGERNAINADFGPIIDRYTTGEEPDDYDHIKIEWPSNKTYNIKKPTIFEYTVPSGEVPRYGAFQVSPTPDTGSEPRYSSILSETMGGPPMEGKETSLEGTTPRTSFTVTKPQPGSYVYAILMPGSTYYQCVTPLTTGDWQTNIQLLVMGTL